MSFFSNIFSANIICPYCFHSFSESKVLWRCNSYQCKQAQNLEQDPNFLKYHKSVQLEQPHILVGPKVSKGYATCDKCKNATNVRICPECHSTLPDSKENIIISIIGAPGAGKSYYVGTLLRQLRSKICKFGCSFMFTTRADEDLYNTKFNNKFEKGMKIDKTQVPAGEDNFIGANTPILCNIQDRGGVTRTFTFFDAAGENFDDEAMMAAVTKYLEHSTAILLLLDPLQIKAVQNAVKAKDENADVRESEKIITYDDILENTMRVIRQQLRLSANKKIEIPIAIAFSKWDLVCNSSLHNEGSIIDQDSPHFRNGFQGIDCDNVSMEVESKLAEWECENFVNKVRSNFKTYKFFALSAIGAAPSKAGNVPQIVSKRVEDPFLWLLNQKKIII